MALTAGLAACAGFPEGGPTSATNVRETPVFIGLEQLTPEPAVNGELTSELIQNAFYQYDPSLDPLEYTASVYQVSYRPSSAGQIETFSWLRVEKPIEGTTVEVRHYQVVEGNDGIGFSQMIEQGDSDDGRQTWGLFDPEDPETWRPIFSYSDSPEADDVQFYPPNLPPTYQEGSYFYEGFDIADAGSAARVQIEVPEDETIPRPSPTASRTPTATPTKTPSPTRTSTRPPSPTRTVEATPTPVYPYRLRNGKVEELINSIWQEVKPPFGVEGVVVWDEKTRLPQLAIHLNNYNPGENSGGVVGQNENGEDIAGVVIAERDEKRQWQLKPFSIFATEAAAKRDEYLRTLKGADGYPTEVLNGIGYFDFGRIHGLFLEKDNSSGRLRPIVIMYHNGRIYKVKPEYFSIRHRNLFAPPSEEFIDVAGNEVLSDIRGNQITPIKLSLQQMYRILMLSDKVGVTPEPNRPSTFVSFVAPHDDAVRYSERFDLDALRRGDKDYFDEMEVPPVSDVAKAYVLFG